MSFGNGYWKPYVSVAQRRARAENDIQRQSKKKGSALEPVRIEGSRIADSFWGKGWCRHLESCADFASRLPRGRSYVRSGAVYHLKIAPGVIDAQVLGSSRYQVRIEIEPIKQAQWQALKRSCAGSIGSLLELLQGQLSEQVMRIVADHRQGLFPVPGAMRFRCNCPDWADMCKHVAAALYGVGHRLDQQPDLLFTLRGVDPAELIEAGLAAPVPASADAELLASDQLEALFGIDLGAAAGPVTPTPASAKPARKRSAGKVAPSKGTPASAASPSRTQTSRPPAPFRATGTGIARLRRKLGLSVAEFARHLRVSPACVYRWEAAGPLALRLQAGNLAALQKLHSGPTSRSQKKA